MKYYELHTYRDEALTARSCITIGLRGWLQVLDYNEALFIISDI